MCLSLLSPVYPYYIFISNKKDFREHMQQHRDNRRWVEYCYENCAKMLADKFPDSCVWIVKPSRMNFKTFACYENFFPTYNFGVPSYQQEIVHAWLHLSRLFNNMIKKGMCFDALLCRTHILATTDEFELRISYICGTVSYGISI